MTETEDDDPEFQLAMDASRRIVSQCRNHARKTMQELKANTETAAESTVFRKDLDRAVAGHHYRAFAQTQSHVEATGNAVLAHLEGLDTLLQDEYFRPLPATAVARAVAEVASSSCWILDSSADSDTRAARGYASLFRAMNLAIRHSESANSATVRKERRRLVKELSKAGIEIGFVSPKAKKAEEVSSVTVGAAKAATDYKLTERIKTHVDGIGEMYASLSSISHGESVHILTSWDDPGLHGRRIALVAMYSTQAWSKALSEWIGVAPAPFINRNDLRRLRESIPADRLARLEATATKPKP